MKFLKQIKTEIQDYLYRTGPERKELAQERLKVHRLNLAGKCPLNPYTQPRSNWDRYL